MSAEYTKKKNRISTNESKQKINKYVNVVSPATKYTTFDMVAMFYLHLDRFVNYQLILAASKLYHTSSRGPSTVSGHHWNYWKFLRCRPCTVPGRLSPHSPLACIEGYSIPEQSLPIPIPNYRTFLIICIWTEPVRFCFLFWVTFPSVSVRKGNGGKSVKWGGTHCNKTLFQ